MVETSKCHFRRLRDGFFKYCAGVGLDVGCGFDPLNVAGLTTCDSHPDVKDLVGSTCSATYLSDFKDSQFDFVYSSHTLEHIINHQDALREFWRVLKVGGYLIIYLPHRDLYERTRNLPPWNENHVSMWLPEIVPGVEPKGSYGLLNEMRDVFGPENFEVVRNIVCDYGYGIPTEGPDARFDNNKWVPRGEYSFEVVVKKLK